MTQIIVLAGGASDERAVSLRSGAAVRAALVKNGYTVEVKDPAIGLDTLLPQLKAADVVFLALHGEGGEDGEPQQFLEKHKIAYVGSDSQASALCFDKARYCQILAAENLPIPNTKLVKYPEFKKSELSQKPFVLKPNDGGSSIDTFIIRNVNELDERALKEAFERHGELLLQELIEGDEITIAILGNEALPVIEIIPPQGGEFDYDNKYNGQTQELCPPKNVPVTVQRQAQQLAKEIHDLTGCRDMSRTDIIVTPANELYVLETNTIPGLTDQSLLPRAAGEAGYDMSTLCDWLVQMALQRHNT